MRDFLSQDSFMLPENLVESGWLGHAPFAFHLIATLRPKVFVELGTHNGFSYFCFCQAIKKHGLGTLAYAVDTWRGDEHAGFYGDEVFQKVSDYNVNYSSFSSLMKMTFTEASDKFPDGYIDILHIDGRHFYDDAKNDFEEWLPKVSRNGIIIFHDTNVRDRGFGVWKLFRELREKYKTFEFYHQYGLGILAVGEVPEAISSFFSGDDQDLTEIRTAYGELGARVSREWSAIIAQRESKAFAEEIVRNKQDLESLNTQLEQIRVSADDCSNQRAELSNRLARVSEQVTSLSQLTVDQSKLISRQVEWIYNQSEEIASLSSEVRDLSRELTSPPAFEVIPHNEGLSDVSDSMITSVTPNTRLLRWKSFLHYPFSSRDRKIYRKRRRDKLLKSSSALTQKSSTLETHPLDGKSIRYRALYRHPFNAKKRRAYRRDRKAELEVFHSPTFASAQNYEPKKFFSSQPKKIHSNRPMKLSPKLWFYVGDTIDWLNVHEHVTGVGRVSIELLNSAMSDETSHLIPCRDGRTDFSIVGMSREELDKSLFSKFDGQYGSNVPELFPGLSPTKGDHIFFTGLVWTPKFKSLFQELATQGIGFSVLVHDIIPLEDIDQIDVPQATRFAEWLTVTLQTADRIFVSTAFVREQILRWSVINGVDITGTIKVIPFGSRLLADVSNPESDLSGERFRDLEMGNFVLSVGTIDPRKNQIMLCRLWRKLLQQNRDFPQLVLAGRDDIGIGNEQSLFQDLLQSGKLLVLSGLSDAQISTLVRASRFTAFPSTNEGYGLPVVESLQQGKLCLTSRLPPIEEQAGSLVWYFDPDNLDEAAELFIKAIEQPEAVRRAEEQITKHFHKPSWSEAVKIMRREAIEAAQTEPATVICGAYRPEFPGATDFNAAELLKRAARWCTSTDPEVSILIVNWNASALTLECIRQIWQHTEGHTYEIVIVDNGSAKDDVERLSKAIPGISFIPIGANRFFGEANNIAAESATGKHIVLLNNDAFPQDGWLVALLQTMEENPNLGAVGPMFLWPDGRVQEAGGTIDEKGYPVRYGRGQLVPTADLLTPRYVDYISAAALLIDRKLFLDVGGFDLAFEPAYYEDTDLCFKLRAVGRPVAYCPASRVIHIEGAAANGNTKAEAHRKALGDTNRDKFVSRWGRFLTSREAKQLDGAITNFMPVAWSSPAGEDDDRPVAVVYSPYSITPGGGERYLLSAALQLAQTHRVEVVTSHRYSNLRLKQIGCAFGLDIGMLRFKTQEEFARDPDPDLMLTMGNAILPPIVGRGRKCFYHCQFPFEIREFPFSQSATLKSYQQVIVNSAFTKSHYSNRLQQAGFTEMPIEIVPPPVPLVAPDTDRKRVILSVGRFFIGGHSKRQDLQIEAFRKLVESGIEDVELHFAGSSFPVAEDIDYLASLREAAASLPIFFHVNCSKRELDDLYSRSLIYWHSTGLGRDLEKEPQKAEHFGISIVEAMSGGAIPVVFRAGGPEEIIKEEVNGFFFDDLEELVATSRTLLSETSKAKLEALSLAAHRRAEEFSYAHFNERIADLFEQRAV
ncbi:glycosyltransferase [Martelella alba]|uniref:Glycosyltransferase n=1 Tax=Martelella alba TaxID=2590451 RepID=A0A506TWX4_9HYPH|nr:glycosyltransferase [Martelella alba]TPW26573.1 glycosyltransferase [Martelella alba]